MSREKERKFSNLNPEQYKLSEIREQAYQQGGSDKIDYVLETLKQFFPDDCIDGITSRTLFSQILHDIEQCR